MFVIKQGDQKGIKSTGKKQNNGRTVGNKIKFKNAERQSALMPGIRQI